VALGIALTASTNRTISQLVGQGVLPAIAVLVACSWFLAAPLSRRFGQPRTQLFFCFAATAPIIVVTLLRDGLPRGLGQWHLIFDWWRHGWGQVVNNLASDSEAFLNFVLFVPAGAAWAALTRRYGRTLAALVVGSFVIESLQALLDLGFPDTTDLVANSLGAAVGVGCAAMGVAMWQRSGRATPRSGPGPATQRLSQRSRRFVAAGVGLLVLVTFVTIQWRADAARDNLLAELHRTYDGTTLEDTAPAFFGDGGDEIQALLDRNSVRPDSFVYSADQSSAQVRFPPMYFGFSRCVFVTWTNGGVAFRTGDGDACTDFVG